MDAKKTAKKEPLKTPKEKKEEKREKKQKKGWSFLLKSVISDYIFKLRFSPPEGRNRSVFCGNLNVNWQPETFSHLW